MTQFTQRVNPFDGFPTCRMNRSETSDSTDSTESAGSVESSEGSSGSAGGRGGGGAGYCIGWGAWGVGVGGGAGWNSGFNFHTISFASLFILYMPENSFLVFHATWSHGLHGAPLVANPDPPQARQPGIARVARV